MTLITHLRSSRALWNLLLLGTLSGIATGQTKQASIGSTPANVNNLRTLFLNYGNPTTYGLGNKTSAIAADFKSSSDGSVFVEMVSLEGPTRGFHVYALKPSGQVLLFSDPDVQGLRNFGIPASYFVSDKKTYVLRQAEEIDSSTSGTTTHPVYVIVTYDDDGRVLNTVRLDPELNPIAVAAFGSEDLLVVSVEKSNQSVRLVRLDSSGRNLGEMRLFDEDYGAELGRRSEGSPKDEKYLMRMLTSVQMMPVGDDILMVPIGTKLPLLEISEHGVVHSTQLSIPKGKTLSALVPSTDGKLYIMLSHSSEDAYAVSEEARANGKTTVNFIDRYIYDFNPGDGTLTERIAFANELTPLRESGGDFLFLTTRPEDGRFQVVKGTIGR